MIKGLTSIGKLPKGFKTATQAVLELQQETRYRIEMDYKMAKALLTGKVDSRIIRYAEEMVSIYEKSLKL